MSLDSQITSKHASDLNPILSPSSTNLSQAPPSYRFARTSLLERVLGRRRSSAQSEFDAHGSLGLNLLCCPSEPLVDLVFVHGLGGGSTKTWCLDEDSTLFWPKAWLPMEPGLKNVRIHSYGYDANWMSTKATPVINIHDFGRQLLERLRYSPELSGSGQNPIVFIAHSMGGLVVKQAYVLARQDPSYAELAKRIEAMLFMATPHRGSDLAQTLNNILRASTAHSPRAYIQNLMHQNELLSLLNDSFRHYATDVSLYSFYESRATELYLRTDLIVTKESAVLGYQHEGHSMLDADHRSICKFTSPADPNYVAVRETLQNILGTMLAKISTGNQETTWRDLQQIDRYLAMPERPDDDLKDLEEARMEGSCEWFADRETFQTWMDPDAAHQSMVYSLSANPATGKSVLSGYVVNALTSLSLDCSYYFFRHGDKDKSTVNGFLRSLLYQMAVRNASVRQQLLSLIEKAIPFNKDDSKSIWRKVVLPILSRINSTRNHFWVLDALDECADFEALFPMIASLKKEFGIRVLITSRKLPEITEQFAELRRNPHAIPISTEEISFEDTKLDIQLFLDGNRSKFHIRDEKQKDIFINQIISKSEGCFLWVRLVLDELALAWSAGEVQRILDEVPQDMDPLYSRALTIMSSRSKPNRDLAHAILTWIICALRPLTVNELREALLLDLGAEVSELEMAIASLCAQLVHVDKTGRVMIVHLTAKSFLVNPDLDSEFCVDVKAGHHRLSGICLQFLCSDQMKVPGARRLRRKQNHPPARSPFATYACFEFAEHLRHTTSSSSSISTKLYDFLESNVLAWIEFVATEGSLSALTRTANSIKAYVQRHIRSSSPLGEFVHLTQNWVVDLHHLVIGFGPNLLMSPSAIYSLIPPFCPKSSAIVATASSRFKGITVRGLTDKGWNDRLCSIDTRDRHVSSVACDDAVFAVGYQAGTITIFRNSTCLPWKTIEHHSPVQQLLFNGASTHLLSAGRRDVKVWETESGFMLWSFEVSHDVMQIALSEDGEMIMAADRSNTLTSWSMQSGRVERTVSWTHKTPFHDEGKFRRPPITAALSPDGSLVAIVYRGRPICLFDVEEDVTYGLLSRESDPMAQRLGTNTSPTSIVFNARKENPRFAAAYEDGDLSLFDYEELTLLETVQAHAQLVACSPDGLTLVTGNSAGMVQLLEFDTLQLLYRVNAADYGIRGLSFSTDNQRFLDVRGTQCNVWEPAVLSGMAKRDDSSTEPAEWEPIIKGLEDDELEITSIELEGSGRFFFVGRSDGSVSVHDISSGGLRKVLYRHNYNISVTSVAWAAKENAIATADTACRFIVCALKPDPETGWTVASKLLDRKADSMIRQLLLGPSNNLLLVSTEESNSVWNITTRQLISTHPWRPEPSFCWINHPESLAHRMLVTATTLSVSEWESANRNSSTDTPLKHADDDAPRQAQGIKNVFSFAQGTLLVVELSELYNEKFTTEAVVFSLAPLQSDRPQRLDAVAAFTPIGVRVMHLVGGYGSRLVFVDSTSWVCSVDTSQGGWQHYSRHFSIPSDWQSQQRSLQMAATGNGDVLFVRGNEVAIISNGMNFEERIRVEH